ncbi:MAG: hypothetical protein MJ074_08425 [Oscillospiraceae bacterium]|nr:hypothetical protein [Oscillospiraceae bacterium]
MRLLEAIEEADRIRPNEIRHETKALYIYELEGEIAEIMEAPMHQPDFPDYTELLVPKPFDTLYQWFLAARIDLENQDNEQYVIDRAAFLDGLNAFRAWWARNRLKKKNGNWVIW